MLEKILIANRGEIAIRIIRAARVLGIKTVAVYSKADEHSLHVKLADEAVRIGESPASKSYLNQEAILAAAEITKAKGIHPGYGFLAENEDFAKKCEDLGYTFIGPSAEVIELMGNKAMARSTMIKTAVPVVPGSDSLTDAEEALRVAEEIGFPVMIKASAGGGGKGMRACFAKEDFLKLFKAAQQETKYAFDDEEMYVEKFIENPRHIEIQILGDRYGNIIGLGERDCSIQRNHQKMIEEAPSPFIDEKLRKKMNDTAIRAAKAVNYLGAGTIEFILDEDKNFYFIEMNTRIQVEHPVTEMITGVDIVDWQLRIASGEELNLKQEEIQWKGHAIECRINAEAPELNFRPSPGKIEYLHLPGGEGIRTDTFIYGGYSIPPDYDSLLLKIIAQGKDRETAIAKMKAALEETVIVGIATNLDFQYEIMDDSIFLEGRADTSFMDKFIEKNYPEIDWDDLLK